MLALVLLLCVILIVMAAVRMCWSGSCRSRFVWCYSDEQEDNAGNVNTVDSVVTVPEVAIERGVNNAAFVDVNVDLPPPYEEAIKMPRPNAATTSTCL